MYSYSCSSWSTAIFSAWLSPFDPFAQNIRSRLKPPGGPYWLGTDGYGRDILSRIIWGARISLTVGVVAVSIGATLGILVGLVSGFFGGAIDNLLMRIVDILLVLPTVLLALVIVAMLGPGVFNLMVAVGISNAPRFARVIRAEVLAVKKMVFVDAASALGASYVRLMFETYFTEHFGEYFGVVHPQGCASDHHRSQPEFPGSRRGAADSDMGFDDFRRSRST